MASIIKISDYRREAVLLSGRRPRKFTPSCFQGASDGEQGPPNEVALQRASLESAALQAERILAEAEARAADVMREAMVRGYGDGLAQGLREAETQTRDCLARLAELAKRATFDRQAMVRSTREEMVALALAIAARVIHREVASDGDVVHSVVESALEKVPPGEAVRILVHPADADLLREKWSELRGAVPFGDGWEVVGDDRMDRGGCVVETRGGVVDSRIETQLAQIAAAFEAGP